MSGRSVWQSHSLTDISSCHNHVTGIAILLGQDNQVISYGIGTSVRNITHVENITGSTGIPVDQRIVFECDIPCSALPVSLFGFIEE